MSMKDALDPNSLFENFGHIGHGKKMKRPVLEAVEHQYESEVDVYVSRDQKEPLMGKAKISWTVEMDSKPSGIRRIAPVVLTKQVSLDGEQVSLESPEIEIMASEAGVKEIALMPFEIDVYGSKATVRFYGG